MALSRIDENGRTHTPSLFNLLSIDNSMGDMPESCVNESIPHLLKAEKDAPDEPGPFILLYPMREYTTTENPDMLYEMYYGDRFLKEAINNGFPLACVVSTDHFLKHSEDVYKKSILVVPAAMENDNVMEALQKYAQVGGKVIVYGSQKALASIDFACCKVDIGGLPTYRHQGR